MNKPIELAREILIDAFEKDPDFVRVYVDNVACVLMDGQGSGPPLDMRDPEVRNEYARQIMKWLFSRPPEPSSSMPDQVQPNRVWRNDIEKYSAPTIEEATRLRNAYVEGGGPFEPEPMRDDEIIEVKVDSVDDLPDWLKGESRAQPIVKDGAVSFRATAKVFASHETGCICTLEY